eukprot:4293424-Amphidinium_carterae.1
MGVKTFRRMSRQLQLRCVESSVGTRYHIRYCGGALISCLQVLSGGGFQQLRNGANPRNDLLSGTHESLAGPTKRKTHNDR